MPSDPGREAAYRFDALLDEMVTAGWEGEFDARERAALNRLGWFQPDDPSGSFDEGGYWHPAGCQCLSDGHCSIELDSRPYAQHDIDVDARRRAALTQPDDPSGPDVDAAWARLTAGPCSVCGQRPYEDPAGTVRCEHIQAIARAVRENRPLIEAVLQDDCERRIRELKAATELSLSEARGAWEELAALRSSADGGPGLDVDVLAAAVQVANASALSSTSQAFVSVVAAEYARFSEPSS